ncbi:hypothetical protein [Bifidobacterium sp. ESL0745]|uniref:hypothetical protein n=1 Tax=Bifidobacterium sp. ESL0745 TaxID=2983226 RepID=UPI0023F70F70|nr:hypothetical protein [Bifidobacterium sp. ESL0745]MDF7664519.1 hypothetical protein [Bifidobacterium sp. ESL0745]
MKLLKKIVIALFVAVTVCVAPVAANAAERVDMASDQVVASQNSVIESAPQSARVPITPVEGDTLNCNEVGQAHVQQCLANQPRSAISAGTSVRFNWWVIAMFTAFDVTVLAVVYVYEANKDAGNVLAQHCSGRYLNG